MTTNVGTIDRILRALLGGGYCIWRSSAACLFKLGASVIGVVMLSTAALRICPLYSIVGIKTCRS